jgi:hypothetical protein
MTPENPLALDVAVRTTRGRACPHCGGKIIPSDRAVYQSSGDPEAVFPVWQCERCGYEELSARPKAAKAKVEPPKPGKTITAAAGPRVSLAEGKPKTPAVKDLQGRAYPPDVLQLLERFKPPAAKDS